MTRRGAFLLWVVFAFGVVQASPLAAQTADLKVTLDVSTSPVAPSTVIPFAVTVENLGPDAATQVEFNAGSGNNVCTQQKIPALAAGEKRIVNCQAVAERDAFAVSIGASAFPAAGGDPDLTNNVASIVIRVVTPPDLEIYSSPPEVVDTGLPYKIFIGYANRAYTEAKNVVISIPSAGGAGQLPENCSLAFGEITCMIGDVPARPLGGNPDFRGLELELLAPLASYLHVPIRLQIRSDDADAQPSNNFFETSTYTYRTYFVTTANDSGTGSLRAAIEEANASCREFGFCKIAFRIPPGSAKWQTITPQTPLPLLLAPGIDVDGLVQARYLGDTNDAGPEIELSGAALREGNGIEFACTASIRGLVINGFPGSAIESRSSTCPTTTRVRSNYSPAIERSYLGTDATGMTAVPNLRGIHLGNAGVSTINDNVISGNLRSGIFIHSGNLVIARNLIGFNRIPSAGLGNGASGIYLGEGATGTDVKDNYIGFNHHFGISLHPQTRWNAFSGNSFQANFNQAIDFGLDGPTDAVPERESNSGFVFRPEITSARYDAAADETIIEGSSRTPNERYEVWVNLYSNDERDPSGYGEGQYYLGAAKADQDRTFRFVFKGRVPGRWIAATTTRINIIGFARGPEPQTVQGSGFTSTTSEFGRAVEVQ